MNWDQIEGQWKELRGMVRQQWGRLSEDDLEVIHGERDKLVGLLQKRYGYARDRAEREVRSWREALH